jgi:hypothetical protein
MQKEISRSSVRPFVEMVDVAKGFARGGSVTRDGGVMAKADPGVLVQAVLAFTEREAVPHIFPVQARLAVDIG